MIVKNRLSSRGCLFVSIDASCHLLPEISQLRRAGTGSSGGKGQPIEDLLDVVSNSRDVILDLLHKLLEGLAVTVDLSVPRSGLPD